MRTVSNSWRRETCAAYRPHSRQRPLAGSFRSCAGEDQLRAWLRMADNLRGVHVFVHAADVLVHVLAHSGEAAAICTADTEPVNLFGAR